MSLIRLIRLIRRFFGQPSDKKTIIRGPNGKYIGYVQERIFHTTRDAKKHYFYKLGGYSISTCVLEALQNADVKEVDIIEHRDSGDRELYSTLTDWFIKSESYTYKGDCQRILPFKYLEVKTS